MRIFPETPDARQKHHGNVHADHRHHPAKAHIGSNENGVNEGDWPRQVRDPVNRPPEIMADVFSQHARKCHRQHQIKGNGAKRDPEGLIG